MGYYFQNGRMFQISGDTPSETEQARIDAKVGPRQAKEAPATTGGSMGSLEAGFRGAGADIATALAKAAMNLGAPETGQGIMDYATAMRERTAKEFQPRISSFEQIGGIGDLASYLGTVGGQSAGYMIPSLAGAGLATLAAPASVPGAIAGTVGYGATALPGFFGANIAEQMEENKTSLAEAETIPALGAATAQTALDIITPAKLGVFGRIGKMVGDPALAPIVSEAEKRTWGEFVKQLPASTAKAMMYESGTETLQEALAMFQSNPERLSNLGAEDLSRLANAAFGGAVLGGGLNIITAGGKEVGDSGYLDKMSERLRMAQRKPLSEMLQAKQETAKQRDFISSVDEKYKAALDKDELATRYEKEAADILAGRVPEEPMVPPVPEAPAPEDEYLAAARGPVPPGAEDYERSRGQTPLYARTTALDLDFDPLYDSMSQSTGTNFSSVTQYVAEREKFTAAKEAAGEDAEKLAAAQEGLEKTKRPLRDTTDSLLSSMYLKAQNAATDGQSAAVREEARNITGLIRTELKRRTNGNYKIIERDGSKFRVTTNVVDGKKVRTEVPLSPAPAAAPAPETPASPSPVEAEATVKDALKNLSAEDRASLMENALKSIAEGKPDAPLAEKVLKDLGAGKELAKAKRGKKAKKPEAPPQAATKPQEAPSGPLKLYSSNGTVWTTDREYAERFTRKSKAPLLERTFTPEELAGAKKTSQRSWSFEAPKAEGATPSQPQQVEEKPVVNQAPSQPAAAKPATTPAPKQDQELIDALRGALARGAKEQKTKAGTRKKGKAAPKVEAAPKAEATPKPEVRSAETPQEKQADLDAAKKIAEDAENIRQVIVQMSAGLRVFEAARLREEAAKERAALAKDKAAARQMVITARLKRQAASRAIKALLDKVGMKNVRVEIVDTLSSDRPGDVVEALYDPDIVQAGKGIIKIADDVWSPSLTLDQFVQQMSGVAAHELLHHIRAAKAISVPEWKALVKHARNTEAKMRGTKLGMTWMERAAVIERNPKLTKQERAAQIEKIEEEAVAEAFRDFVLNGPVTPPQARGLFKRILGWIRGLYAYKSAKANEVMGDILSGKYNDISYNLQATGPQTPYSRIQVRSYRRKEGGGVFEQLQRQTDRYSEGYKMGRGAVQRGLVLGETPQETRDRLEAEAQKRIAEEAEAKARSARFEGKRMLPSLIQPTRFSRIVADLGDKKKDVDSFAVDRFTGSLPGELPEGPIAFNSPLINSALDPQVDSARPQDWTKLLKQWASIDPARQEELDDTGIIEMLDEETGPISKEDILNVISATQPKFDLSYPIRYSRVQQLEEGINNLRSSLDTEIEMANVGAQSPQQWISLLKSWVAKGRVKTEEIEDRGLFEALEMSPPDTKLGKADIEWFIEDTRGGIGMPNLQFVDRPQWEQYTIEGSRNGYRVVRLAGYQVLDTPSAHFNEDQLTQAFVRYKIRNIELPNGSTVKVVHIEEVQSDAHQQARKSGYEKRGGEEIIPIESEEDIGLPPDGWKAKPAVPDIPFKRSWQRLMLQAAIKAGIAEGAEGVLVSPGSVVSDRFYHESTKPEDAKRMRDGHIKFYDGDLPKEIRKLTNKQVERIVPTFVEDGRSGKREFPVKLRYIDDGMRNGDRKFLYTSKPEEPEFHYVELDAKTKDEILGIRNTRYSRVAVDPALVRQIQNDFTNVAAVDAVVRAVKKTGLNPDWAQDMVEASFQKIQDKMLPLGRIIDSLRKNGLEVPEEFDSYAQFSLMRNRVADRIRVITETTVNPLIDLMRTGIKFNEADLESLRAVAPNFADFVAEASTLNKGFAEAYGAAMHAPERNAAGEQRNPDGTDSADQFASGFYTDEAVAARRWFQSHREFAGIQKIHVARKTLQAEINALRQEYDLSPDWNVVGYGEQFVAAGLPNGFREYVPLRGRGDEDIDVDPNNPLDRKESEALKTGRGVSTTGPEDRAFLGRGSITLPDGTVKLNRPPPLITEHMVQMMMQAIIRGEKNKVGNSVYNLLNTFANQRVEYRNRNVDLSSLARVIYSAPMKRALVDGVVKLVSDHNFKYDERMLITKIRQPDGTIKEVIIEVLDKRLRDALTGANGFGSEDAALLLTNIGKVTQFMAKVSTQWNPLFPLTNFPRDLVGAAINLQQYDIPGLTSAVMKGVPTAAKAIWKYQTHKGMAYLASGKEAPRAEHIVNGENWTEILERFQAAGGNFSVFDLTDINDIHKEINEKIAPNPKNLAAVWAGVKRFGNFIDSYNKVVENSIRLATFKAMVDAGASDSIAANAAQNVTTNYGRGGIHKSTIGALWMFFNANVQGSMTILNAMQRSKAVRRVVAATILTGMFQDMMMALLAGEDDETGANKYDMIPDWLLETRMVFVDPTGASENGFFSFPMPYGYNSAFNFGRALSRYMRDGYTEGEAVNSMLGSIVNSFNPLGGNQSFWAFVSPTITDPFVELTLNEDWSGRPIYKAANPFEVEIPLSQRHWNSTSDASKWLTSTLHTLTGGGPTTPAGMGWTEWSPDAIDYLFRYYLGGAGAAMGQTLSFITDTIPRAMAGEEWETREIPAVSKFFGNVGSGGNTDKFFKIMDEVKRVKKEIDLAKDSKDYDLIRDTLQENKVMYRFSGSAEALANQRRAINSRIRQINNNPQISDEKKAELVGPLMERMRDIEARVIKQYNERVRNAEVQ